MTTDDVCAAMVRLGGREFRHPLHRDGIRAFSFRTESATKCECNGRSPDMHVHVWLLRHGNGYTHETVEFEICGEYCDTWANMKIIGVKYDDAESDLTRHKLALLGMWEAYCARWR